MTEYPNVIGVLGLCTRDGQRRNQDQLLKVIKERKLQDANVEQWEDPDGDYIWVVFFNGTLQDDVQDVAGWIIDNDNNRLW